MNLPNKLTICRICMIPLFVVAYFLPYFWSPFVAAGIFILAAFTDFLDGHIARKYNLVTDLGKLLDPIADKVLVCAALICAVATNPFASIALDFARIGTLTLAVCSILILARELLVDAVRMIAAAKGVVVQANVFGKIKTVMQDITMPCLVVCNVIPYFAKVKNIHILGIVAIILLAVTTLVTVISGIIYMVQNKKIFETK